MAISPNDKSSAEYAEWRKEESKLVHNHWMNHTSDLQAVDENSTDLTSVVLGLSEAAVEDSRDLKDSPYSALAHYRERIPDDIYSAAWSEISARRNSLN